MSINSDDGYWERIKKSEEARKKEKERYIEVVEGILKHFECKKCGKCCKDKDIRLVEGDIERLPVHPKNMGSFIADRETLRIIRYIKYPCEFLAEDNLCGVYKFKPTACRIYPFELNKNLCLCPLGKEIYEEIKKAKKAKVETFADFLEYLEGNKNIKIGY